MIKLLIFVRSDWKTVARSGSVDLVEAEGVNSEADALIKEPFVSATTGGFCIIDELMLYRRCISRMKVKSGYSMSGLRLRAGAQPKGVRSIPLTRTRKRPLRSCCSIGKRRNSWRKRIFVMRCFEKPVGCLVAWWRNQRMPSGWEL